MTGHTTPVVDVIPEYLMTTDIIQTPGGGKFAINISYRVARGIEEDEPSASIAAYPVEMMYEGNDSDIDQWPSTPRDTSS